MWNFNHKEDILGMIQVDVDRVIVACNNTLHNIYEYRSNARREYCKKWLNNANKNWYKLWRWFGFQKPVLRDALVAFYHTNHPPFFEIKMTYKLQEQDCKELLMAAKATSQSIMWISTKSVKICRL